MLKLAITFDYELFLGENRSTSEEILFTPTKRILDILKSNGATATFFADVCSIIRHKELSINDYCVRFENQIKDMVENGADVQLHIHPNWLLSDYENEKWKMNTVGYRLHYFMDNKKRGWEASSIVSATKDYLSSTLRMADSSYQCIAYRAGGFAIQPHAEIQRLLTENGIYIDSSIVLNDYNEGELFGYDFQEASSVKNWWFGPDEDLCKSTRAFNSDSMYEVPILTEQNGLIKRLFLPKNRMFYQKSEIKGAPITAENGTRGNAFQKLHEVVNYHRTYRRLSLDAMTSLHLCQQLVKINKSCNDKDVYACIIGHPKAFTGEAFDNFDGFLKLVKNDTDIEIVNMKDISARIAMPQKTSST